MREVEDELREVRTDQAALKQREAAPVADAWKEFTSVTEALAGASDPEAARMRLRALLRRMVKAIWCLFMPGTGARVAWVQVVFAGEKESEKFHHFAIVYRPRHGLTGGQEYPAAFAVQDLATQMKAGDLRDAANGRALEEALAAVDPQTWAEIVPHRNQRMHKHETAEERRTVSRARVPKWRALRNKGKSYAEIAAAEDPPVSTNTVHYMLNGRKPEVTLLTGVVQGWCRCAT